MEIGVDDRSPGSLPTSVPSNGRLQLFPRGIIYRAYLASVKEARFRSVWNHEKGGDWFWDITLGGRLGVFRYGSEEGERPEGFQVDLEGAGIPRLSLTEDAELEAADYRFGIPVTWGTARHQVKLAYYHVSSHLGDEFMQKHPTFKRLNYSRDVLVYGHSLYPTPWTRLYAEIGYAFVVGEAEPLEAQFGWEYSPPDNTGFRGAPFAAVGASPPRRGRLRWQPGGSNRMGLAVACRQRPIPHRHAILQRQERPVLVLLHEREQTRTRTSGTTIRASHRADKSCMHRRVSLLTVLLAIFYASEVLCQDAVIHPERFAPIRPACRGLLVGAE